MTSIRRVLCAESKKNSCGHNARERVAEEMQTDPNTDNKPVTCDSCKSSLRVDALSHLEYWMLQDQHYYDGFQDELRMLLRVQTYTDATLKSKP